MKLSVTETAIVGYRFDNRDRQRQNDFYGEWLNRLNVQLTTWRITAAVRLDSALYFAKNDPAEMARADVSDAAAAGQPTQGLFTTARDKYGVDLSSRYNNTFYPSKIFVTYAQPGLDITLGDFYAQLGRGLVLAARKVDELGVDTTIRGAKIDYKLSVDDWRLGALALAGFSNPLRVDEATGRQLSQSSSGMRGLMFPGAPHPNSTDYVTDPKPSFSPDGLIGGRLEGGVRQAQIAFQGVQLERSSDQKEAPFLTGNDNSPVKNARRVRNASVSLNVPNLAGHGSFYVEVASQSLDDSPKPDDTQPAVLLKRLSGGTAAYANLSLFTGDFAFTIEGKRYDRYYPLSGNVSRSVTDFSLVQYNAPPTTEPIWSDSQFNLFNVCVLGGRVRVDYRASSQVLVYGSFGRYRSYSEVDQNCGQTVEQGVGGFAPAKGKTSDIQNDVYDPIAGVEMNFEHGRSHIFAWTGVRYDRAGEATTYPEIPAPIQTFYRESYIRYDLVKKVVGPWSVQTVGFQRWRYNPVSRSQPWSEGENYVSVIYSPKVTAAFGYEHTAQFGPERKYFNGMAQYRFTTDSLVRVFVGQSRPALRCVSGVCRFFPEYAGAKVEAVVRF